MYLRTSDKEESLSSDLGRQKISWIRGREGAHGGRTTEQEEPGGGQRAGYSPEGQRSRGKAEVGPGWQGAVEQEQATGCRS